MTDRLYYYDSTLLEFDARIVKISEKNGKWRAVLDRTAFYPTSGGQSYDTGCLSGIQVLEVTERPNGDILHITDKSPGDVGQLVHGLVDSQRRLCHRQSHTAQHILSQAFIQACKAETISVHLGDKYCSIELDCDTLSEKELSDSVSLANDIILANLPVAVLFVSQSEAKNLPLRKIPSREGTIRVIQIGDFDFSACGGTHSPRTAEVRFINLLKTDKLRGHLLVSFLAGETALSDFSRLTAVMHKISSDLTCAIEDMPARVKKLLTEAKESRAIIARLRSELLPCRLTALAGRAKREGNLPYVSESLAELDIDTDIKTARALATNLAKAVNGVAILGIEGNIVLAVTEELSLKASALVKEIATQNGLRGGGNETLAQLGGVTPEDFAILSSKLITLAANDCSC